MTARGGQAPGRRRSRWPAWALALAAVAALAAAGWTAFAWRAALDARLASAPSAIRGAGAWGVLGSIGLMVLHSFVPFPSELLATANGLVFGPWLGALASWTGSMLGAGLTFFVARRYGHPALAGRLTAGRAAAVARWTARHGTAALLAARLIPLVSFNLLNVAAGVAGVRWGAFLWTTAIGILPMTVLTAVLGARMVRLPAWTWGVAAAGLAALVGIVRLVRQGDRGSSHEP